MPGGLTRVAAFRALRWLGDAATLVTYGSSMGRDVSVTAKPHADAASALRDIWT